MYISEMTIQEFLEKLSSKDPVPGGGSTSAIIGALGISLNNMVSSLTINNNKYLSSHEIAATSLKKGYDLQQKFINLCFEDIKAYKKVSDAYKMPKNTLDEIKLRNESVQLALKEATIVPYNIMETSLEAINITEKSLSNFNKNALTDVASSAINLKACAKEAWLNVLVNINLIKDKEFNIKYRSKGENVLKEVILNADKIYDTIINKYI